MDVCCTQKSPSFALLLGRINTNQEPKIRKILQVVISKSICNEVHHCSKRGTISGRCNSCRSTFLNKHSTLIAEQCQFSQHKVNKVSKQKKKNVYEKYENLLTTILINLCVHLHSVGHQRGCVMCVLFYVR